MQYLKVNVEGFKTAIAPLEDLATFGLNKAVLELLEAGKSISLSQIEMAEEEFEALREFEGYRAK